MLDQDQGVRAEPSRFRRGLSTLLGMPTWPVRKILPYGSDLLPSESRRRYGLTLVLSGIEGRGPFVSSLALGLNDGWQGSVEVFEWTSRRLFSTLSHIRSEPRSREQAERLADLIEAHWQSDPQSPVNLVGHSGGAGVIVFALESLARRRATGDIRSAGGIQSAVLLGAALSRDYDLAESLESVEQMHSFYSPLDIPHLVLGTAIVGAMDRKHGICGGFRGFRRVDGERFERLVQHPYETKMARSWHWGGHMGWTNRVFAAEHLAPLLASRDG